MTDRAHMQRQRTTTDADVAAIVKAMQAHQQCNMGLTASEVDILKRALAVWNRSTNIIGTVILVTIVAGLIAIFTKGFWMSLFEGLSKIAPK